jgi:predicted alpha/beta-fold hydrolase
MREFIPHPVLRNAHAMTLAGALLPRRFPRLPQPQERLFAIEPGTQLLAKCHWQPEPAESPTLVLVHGLEGSSESAGICGVAEKAWVSGFNVIRVNQRNRGGTERLTRTLYNSGLSGDFAAVLRELVDADKLPEVFFGGSSQGGNLVLKMAGELGSAAPVELRGVVTVCPALDLAACADALAAPGNGLYEWHFVRSLRASMRRKAALFPGAFRLDGLDHVRTVREFDDLITAPYFGYRDASDYYAQASAARVVDRTAVPTLIITAQDDPFVPYSSFAFPGLTLNPYIQFVAPEHGGHCAFVSSSAGWERYWAEARVIEFCLEHSKQRVQV